MSRFQGTFRYVLLSLVAFLLLTGSSVHAQDACNTLVIDDAGIFQNKFSEVEASAKKLENLGADVRIRTISSLGSFGTLDAYEAKLEKSCASWQTPDGERKNNLVVMMVAVKDRKIGTFYGEQWKRTLDPVYLNIHSDRMGPRFRDGDWAGGFVAGLTEVTRLLDLELHPAPVAQTPVIVTPAPDFSWVGQVAIILFGGIAIVVVIIGGYRFFQTRKSEEEQRRIAQQRASEGKRSVINLTAQLTRELDDLKDSVELVVAEVHPRIAGEAKQKLADADSRYSDFMLQFDRHEETVRDPNRQNLSKAEYAVISESYSKLDTVGALASASQQDLRSYLSTLEREIEQAPRALSNTERALEEALAVLDQVTKKGFTLKDEKQTLQQAGVQLTAAKQHVAERDFSNALHITEQLKPLIRSVTEQAQGVEKRRDELLNKVASLRNTLDSIPSIQKDMQGRLNVLQTRYSAEVFTSVEQQLAAIPNLLSEASATLDDANEAVSMDSQDWNKAESHLAEVTSILERIQANLRAVKNLEASLAKANAEISSKVETTAEAISTARNYLANHRGDVEEQRLLNQLEAEESNLAHLSTSLQTPKPDLLSSLGLLEAIMENVGRTHMSAQNQFVSAERKRQEKRKEEEEEAARRRRRRSQSSSSAFGAGYGSSHSSHRSSSSHSSGGGGSSSFGGGGGGGGSSSF